MTLKFILRGLSTIWRGLVGRLWPRLVAWVAWRRHTNALATLKRYMSAIFDDTSQKAPPGFEHLTPTDIQWFAESPDVHDLPDLPWPDEKKSEIPLDR